MRPTTSNSPSGFEVSLEPTSFVVASGAMTELLAMAARLDVRVVAATNRKLDDLVSAGQFREDFLQRLRLIHLHVPPLRERPEDVPVLMRHFLARSGRELSFTDGALRALLRYGWPGNVRELMNTIEQLVWLSAGAVVAVQHLPLSMRTGPGLITSRVMS